jgi:methyl-accepting chemotaxis protein
MQIKTKLTLNVAMLIIIVTGVAITSVVGMGFVKNNLTHLTKRSTPFQIRTMELQRSIQQSTTDLVRLAAARDSATFSSLKSRVEQSLSAVNKCQENIAALSSNSTENAAEELKLIFTELTEITGSRIKANDEAQKANQEITRKLGEAASQLKNLDRQIKELQGKSSSAFTRSMGEMKGDTSTVRNLEQLMLTLKDLQLGFLELAKSQSKKGILITQGKCNSAISKAQQNEYMKNSASQGSTLKQLSGKINEFVKAQNAVLGQSGADTSSRDSILAEINEKLNGIILNVEQEALTASERYTQETAKQGQSFSNSTLATGVMAGNSELLAQGLTV